MTDERTLPADAVDAMVALVAPTWTVRSAAKVEHGYAAVYRIVAGTLDGEREVYLKATRQDDAPDQGIALESRILSLLDARTDLPVPTVCGAVDDHETVPSPFFVAEGLPGRSVPRPDHATVDDATLETLARAVGRHLADLHAIDAVDAYGLLEPADEPRSGGRPPADPAAVRVVDPTTDWPAYCSESVAGPLDALESGPFADLADDLRAAVEGAVGDLPSSPRPVLAHVDCSIENCLLADDGTPTAMLDWAFTVAATPGYDLAFVVHSLAGGPWWFHPSIPDRQELVREALLSGYEPVAPDDGVAEFRAHRECYELLAAIHSTTFFEDRLAEGGATDAEVAAARTRHREVLRELC